MEELKVLEEYPVIMPDGSKNTGLVRHWCPGYSIVQIETGIEYQEAVDVYPCRYTYRVGNRLEKEELTDEVRDINTNI